MEGFDYVLLKLFTWAMVSRMPIVGAIGVALGGLAVFTLVVAVVDFVRWIVKRIKSDGIALTDVGIFRSCSKKYKPQIPLICPKCEETFVLTASSDWRCPKCRADLELLEGFYERHPKLMASGAAWSSESVQYVADVYEDQANANDMGELDAAGEQYSALREGFTKEFSVTTTQSDETREKKLEATAGPKTNLKGLHVYTCKITVWTDAGPITRKDFFLGNGQGLRVIASQRLFDAGPRRKEQDLWTFKYPLAVGTTWTKTKELKFLKEKITVPVTCLIETMDDIVVVPAGTFEKCMKIKESFSGKVDFGYWGKPDVTTEFYSWFAPSLGHIKTTYTVKCSIPDLGGEESHTEMISYKN